MPLGVLKDIRRIYSGLNAEQIRHAAARDVSVGLLANREEAFEALERFLIPVAGLSPQDAAARAEILRTVHRVGNTPPERFDFVLCAPGMPVPANGFPFDPNAPETAAKAIVSAKADLETAIGRQYPFFRPAVSRQIVGRIARENALFSLVTALPNVVPSVIDLPWAVGEFATDTAFLTMNQIRMALLLAAAHSHPVGYKEQRLSIGAIVGGAFGWRALSRELVGKIPFGGGLVPKAAIAFAGTWVVGLGLEKINRLGAGLSRDEKRDAWADAFARGKDAVLEIAPQLAKQGPGQTKQAPGS